MYFCKNKNQMSNIAGNLQEILELIPDNVKLIAVSKLKPVEDIQQAYLAGQRCFGENKALEMKSKYETLPKDIEWHFIGHLQSNKIKYILPFVRLIHSIDSLKLLKEINRQAAKHNQIIHCLLQFYIATEDTKFGFSLKEAVDMLEDNDFKKMKNIRLCGVMGIATYTNDKDLIRKEFQTLYSYFNHLKSTYFQHDALFTEVSMGMTDDFPLAMEEGSTMVRIGSAIFGQRNYNL